VSFIGEPQNDERQPETPRYFDALLRFQAWCQQQERPFRESMIEAMAAFRALNPARDDEPAGRPGHPLDGVGRKPGRNGTGTRKAA
jgi:hypothetical protein